MRDIDDEVYRLLLLQKRLTGVLQKMPPNSPDRAEAEQDLAGIRQEIAKVKPNVGSTLINSFMAGESAGIEGKLEGGLRELREAFGGPESDYESRVEANRIIREAGERENPNTARIGEYVIPMINKYSPMGFLTNSIIKGGNMALDAYKGAKAASALKAAPVTNLINNYGVKISKEADVIGKVATKQAQEAAKIEGLINKVRDPDTVKTLVKENYIEGLKHAGVRGAVGTGVVSIADTDPNDNLLEQSMEVLAKSAIGGVIGIALPATIGAGGKVMTTVGTRLPGKFGEFFARLPDNEVKGTLTNVFRLKKEELENIKPEDLNWLRQYIQLAASRGEPVVGGNRASVIKFTENLTDTLLKRNNDLIDISVREGKALSAEALKKAIKSQFKSVPEQDAVEKIFKDFGPFFKPSNLALYGPQQLEKITSESKLSPEEVINMLKAAHGKTSKTPLDIDKLIEQGNLIIEHKYNARDLYTFQQHLHNQLNDVYGLGFQLSPEAAISKRVLKKTAEAINMAYKHLEPDISAKNPQLSIKKSASDIRKALTLRTEMARSMNRQEAETAIASGYIKKSAFYAGIPYFAGWYLTKDPTGGIPAMAAGLALQGAVHGGKSIKMSTPMKYELGAGMMNEIPAMMGGRAARPAAAALDMYKNAQQPNPPQPMEQAPVEEEEVPDFTGFGSSQEWLRSQLGQ